MILEPQLRDSDGTWVADYPRLRFAATKPSRLSHDENKIKVLGCDLGLSTGVR